MTAVTGVRLRSHHFRGGTALIDEEGAGRFDGIAEWYATVDMKVRSEIKATSTLTVGCFLVAATVAYFLGSGDGRWAGVVCILGVPASWLFGRWKARRLDEIEDLLCLKLGDVSMAERGQFFDAVNNVQIRRGYKSRH